jgi:antirestriction protein ArdC
MTSEKARAFEEKKRRHVAEIAARFMSEFRKDPITAIMPYTEMARPVNFASGKEYRGQNVFTLNWAKADKGYRWNSWLTFKQARAVGGAVKKGEKGTAIIGAVTGEEGENQVDRELSERGRRFEIPRSESFVGFNLFHVFNVEQVDGLDLVDVAKPGANPFVRADINLDQLIRSSPYEIIFGQPEVRIDLSAMSIHHPSRAAFGVGDSRDVSSKFYTGAITMVELAKILNGRADKNHDAPTADELLAAVILAAIRLRDAGLRLSRVSLPPWLLSRIFDGDPSIGRALRLVDLNL